MVLTNVGLNRIRDLLVADFTTGGIGLSSTAETPGDTGLFGGGTTIDACDSTTGWTFSGDATGITLDTTAGNFQEGTGCLDITETFSTGTSNYQKTVTAFNASGGQIIAYWFYIASKTSLDSTKVDTVALVLGTGGFTNCNEYHVPYASLVSGWNGIQVVAASQSSTIGAGATLSSIDSVRIRVKAVSSINGANMRIDNIRSYASGTMGITDSKATVTTVTGAQFWKTTHSIGTTQSNGLALYEAGDSNGSTLLSRFTFPVVNKTNSTDINIDKYYYVKEV